MYGLNMLGICWGGLNWGNETSGSGFCCELDNSSWLLGTISLGWGNWLFHWAELIVALGIMGLWTTDFSTLWISAHNSFPEGSYMQAGNFCIKHCRDFLIFTQAESKAVLASPGTQNLGLQDPSKEERKKVLTLQAIYKLNPYKSLYLLYIQFSKANKCSNTPGTLANCVQITSRIKTYRICVKQDTIKGQAANKLEKVAEHCL